MPNMAKKVRAMVAVPMVNPRASKKCRSSMGNRARRSHARNPARPKAATAKPVTVSGSVQPRSGPSMIPNRSAPSVTIDSTAPTASSGRPLGSREVGTIAATRAIARRTTGTLTKNTEPHQ